MKKLFEKKPLVISLIGMSGRGKSYWSKKLAKYGFRRICCDDLIEQDLAVELKKHGVSGINDMAHWMGHPYEKRFKRNQLLYLNSEIRNMIKIIDQLKQFPNENIVIDTTGSVIYTGNSIMKSLKKYSLVIHLETPMAIIPRMLKKFIEDPKPVIWQNMFRKHKNETNEEALHRCYLRLLDQRIKLYDKYADVVLKHKLTGDNNFTTKNFIGFVENADKKKRISLV